MPEKIKTDVNKLLLVLIMKTNFPIYFSKIELFFNFETKSRISTSVSIFSNISEILETKFYALWTQTRRNLKSVKFANFRSITCPSRARVVVMSRGLSLAFSYSPVLLTQI